MKKQLIVANLKLYVEDLEAVVAYAKKVARGASRTGADIVICPPAPFIEKVKQSVARAGVFVGAQSTDAVDGKAHTGSVSVAALASAGARFVIVGHSERRRAGESFETVERSLAAVLEAGCTAILCVGEESRDLSSGDHFSVIEQELRTALRKVDGTDAKNIIIAYEPVWAIGKSAADALKPEDLEEMVLYIRKVLVDIFGRKRGLSVPVLYGGSVESENAGALMRSGCSGFLVGHASVDPVSFLMIAHEAAHANKKNGNQKR